MTCTLPGDWHWVDEPPKLKQDGTGFGAVAAVGAPAIAAATAPAARSGVK